MYFPWWRSRKRRQTATNNYSKFVDLHKSWGTSSSDVHFLNMATDNQHTSSFGDYNVNHIDRRYHFYMIGDVETYSGSIGHFSNFTDQKHFYNRQIVSDFTHKNITYKFPDCSPFSDGRI